MAPLAGKPPFATDDPDSIFADQPKPIPRPRKQNLDPTSGAARDSAYTAFDSYFAGNGTDSRASGVGDIGRGLMNAESDYDDSSDDEHPTTKKQAPSTTDQSSDKHRALFAAATGAALSQSPPPSYERDAFSSAQEKQRQPPAQEPLNLRDVKQPQPVVHAHGHGPHASQNVVHSIPPGTRPVGQQRTPPLALQAGAPSIAAPAPVHSRPPQLKLMPGAPQLSPSNPYYAGAMPGSPSPATPRTPQPLPPPQTPIMPVFARPRKESSAVKFEEKGEILRGNSEETLLPRGTGGKGDEFWRRFSMVAKEDAKSGSKKSAWLKKTESGTTRLSTWVWLVGIILLIAIGGGIGLGWYFTHNKPASQPLAIGGSADEGFTSTSSSNLASASASSRPTKVTAAPVPTNTANNNGRRSQDGLPAPAPAPAPALSVHATPTVPAAHRRSFVSRMPH